MKEGDSLSFGANTGVFINQPDAMLPALLEGTVQIVHRKADMVNSGTPFGDELSNRRVAAHWLEQLDK